MKSVIYTILLCFSAPLFAKGDLEDYISRTRGNHSEYERLTQQALLSDKSFVSSCWAKLAPLSFELFYTINTDGKASDIAWFPKNIDASCIKKHILATSFSKPSDTFYGWWLIWDGAGG